MSFNITELPKSELIIFKEAFHENIINNRLIFFTEYVSWREKIFNGYPIEKENIRNYILNYVSSYGWVWKRFLIVDNEWFGFQNASTFKEHGETSINHILKALGLNMTSYINSRILYLPLTKHLSAIVFID